MADSKVSALTDYTTPLDADNLYVAKASDGTPKKTTWANIKATLKTYLDTLYQPLDSDLTTIAGLTATTDNFIVSVASAWASRTPTQVKTTLSLNNVDNTSDATKNSATATQTNKRKQPRVYTAASNTSLTPEIDTYDVFHVTALAGAITINNHSTSTPADGELMEIRLLDNGTARAISFGTAYVAKAGVALPTTTVLSKNLVMLFEYNLNLTKWNLLASGQEA